VRWAGARGGYRGGRRRAVGTAGVGRGRGAGVHVRRDSVVGRQRVMERVTVCVCVCVRERSGAKEGSKMRLFHTSYCSQGLPFHC
jgi:hypothetical protein